MSSQIALSMDHGAEIRHLVFPVHLCLTCYFAMIGHLRESFILPEPLRFVSDPATNETHRVFPQPKARKS